MKQTDKLGDMLLEQLSRTYSVVKTDVGQDAHLSKSGFAFDTEVYEIGDLGHLCFLRMKAMLGLMKMRTIVLAVKGKDVPLLNLDWVKVPGKETQMVELYDTQLHPCPEENLAAYQRLLERDAELQDYVSGGAHWYDGLLYPCSYHKTGKEVGDRLARAAHDYAAEYLKQLAAASDCDAAAKMAKTREFAENLLNQGGPAVDQVTRLFGRETAERLILRHMYGVEE